MYVLSRFSCVQLFATLCVAYQAPLSMGFSRQGYWSGLPFPSPGDLSQLEMGPVSPCKPLTTSQAHAGFGQNLKYLVIKRRRQWHPTPVLLPGNSHGRRSLVGSSPWGPKSRARLSDFTFTHWRRKWQPTPVSLPGESQGRGSLVGYRLWGCTESDTTEAT